MNPSWRVAGKKITNTLTPILLMEHLCFEEGVVSISFSQLGFFNILR
jgi:hypothetical protein